MPTISELSALSALSKLDKFEVERAADNISYSVSAQDIANFVKNISNGGFKGSTTKSLNDFTIADIGMWWWVNSEDNVTGLHSGVIEIISFNGLDDDNVEATFIQRLSFAEKVYQRMYTNGSFSGWGSLSNMNGCKIEYGTSSDTHVDFTNAFADVPTVVAVAKNSTTDKTYLINVYGVSATGFDVQKLASSTIAVVEETETTETESSGTTTKTTVVRQTRSAWEQADNAPFYWIALSDVGG